MIFSYFSVFAEFMVDIGVSVFSLNAEEPFCRICHEGSGAGDLLSPCECAGSLAMVHRVCLERWLTASSTSYCELCHFEFALEILPKPLTEVKSSAAELENNFCPLKDKILYNMHNCKYSTHFSTSTKNYF